jgi:26S proteasome regulatory subunit N13
LVEFNAGKMSAAPKEAGSLKLVVTPDTQKGKIVLTRGDDNLLHFQWKNRQTGAVADV